MQRKLNTTFGLLLVSSNFIFGQLSLSTSGVATVIDFSADIPDVINGPFQVDQDEAILVGNPGEGQLDADAWSIGTVVTGFPGVAVAMFSHLTAPNTPSTGAGSAACSGNHKLARLFANNATMPNPITLRMINNTGAVIDKLDISYEISAYNDRGRSTKVEFFHGLLGDFIQYTAATYTSPATMSGMMETVVKSFSLTGLAIQPGDEYMIRWRFNTVSGSGEAHDEFYLDDISVTPYAVPTVSFVDLAEEVPEAIGTHNVAIQLENYRGVPVTVNVAATGDDIAFDLPITQYVFNGAGTQTIALNILDDAGFHDETIKLALSSADGLSYIDVDADEYTLTVTDDDPRIAYSNVDGTSSVSWTGAVWNGGSNGNGEPITDVNDPQTSVIIQNGHKIRLNNNRAVYNLTVESGGELTSTATSMVFLDIYGPDVMLNGPVSDINSGLGFGINGSTCTISGSEGNVDIYRLSKRYNAESAPESELFIHRNLTISYDDPLTGAVTNGALSGTTEFNVTIAAGVTVTVQNGTVSMDGNDGDNGINKYGTLTVDGTLILNSADLVVRNDNPSGGDVRYIVGPTGKMTVGGSLMGAGTVGGSALSYLTVENGGILTLNGSVGNGIVSNRIVTEFEDGSTVNFAGTNSQTIPGLNYYNLNLSSASKTGGTSDIRIRNKLSLGVQLALTSGNLIIEPGAELAVGATSLYVKTTAEGALKQTVGAMPVLFPVGNDTYNPALLTNTGSSDQFGVRVEDAVRTDGTAGSQLTEKVVNRTWHIEEEIEGGSQVTLTVQWHKDNEQQLFARSECFISHYNDTYWAGSQPAAATAAGANTYTRTRTDISSFSPFAVASLGALPIELLDFQARAAGPRAELSWKTASEYNNRHFVVERSADGLDFRALGTVAGAGTSAEPHDYRFTDPAPGAGVNYYRLRQVDLDGAESFGPVVQLRFEPEHGAPVVYPTVVSEKLFVGFDGETPAAWQIIDGRGQILARGQTYAHQPIDMTLLPAGNYWLRLQTDGETVVRAFVKH